MAKITYVEFSGEAKTVDVPDGWSLMQAAITNNIAGIVGECGGSMACATCHCYVESGMDALPPPTVNETSMLASVAAERRANSRLACQLKPAADMTVRFPERQT